MPRIIDRIVTTSAAAALIGAGLLAAPSGAWAQQSAAPPAAAPAAAALAKPNRLDRVETRIASLHKSLKITPDEEPQWATVAQTMRDNAHAIDQLVQDRASKRGSMNALDDLRSYQAIAAAHDEEMQKLVPAFEALYDAMPPAQKKTADLVFNQRTAARATASPKKG